MKLYNTIEELENKFKNKDFDIGISWESDYIPSINSKLILNKFIWKDRFEDKFESIYNNYEKNLLSDGGLDKYKKYVFIFENLNGKKYTCIHDPSIARGLIKFGSKIIDIKINRTVV